MIWSYYNPVKLIETYDFSEIVNKTLNKSKHLLVCSKRFQETEDYKKIKFLDNIKIKIADKGYPTIEQCNKAILELGKEEIETIVAIGGGSVMDFAKIIRLALMTKSNTIDINKSVRKFIKLVCIPTNWATSAELTKWATVWDKKNNKKLSVEHDFGYPTIAVYDISLSNSLSIENKIIGILDIVSHALDSEWSKKSNPITMSNACRSISIISDNIFDIKNILVHYKFMMASIYAGLAFSSTKTSMSHSISYPITARYNVPHGISCALTLTGLINYIYRNYPNPHIITNKYKWENIIYPEIVKHVPFSLKEYRIPKRKLKEIAKESFTKGRSDNFTYSITENDVIKILQGAY